MPNLSPCEPFLRAVSLPPHRLSRSGDYPFNLPVVRALRDLELHPVTYFVGENGAGKSTLLEAIAVAAGFNAEGGSCNFAFSTRATESELHRAIRLVRSARRPRSGFFLRAETFYNVATEIERLGVAGSYGARSLHELSHGEAFLALMQHRFGPNGLYILDEPEAALSPARQLAFLRRLHALVGHGSQFLIATHAPIVLAYPTARIYQLGENGIDVTTYEAAPQVSLTRDFLNHRERFLLELLGDD
ncbi:MAG: AAA family ATPase [Myxococcales bacterium]|nr:AAA family ATPase [Myxococcales bacterium]